MSCVLGHIQCPQCRYERADTEFNCRTSESYMNCRKCGFGEYVDRETDGEGKFTFTRRVVEGAGVLFYRSKGECGYRSCYLASQGEVAEAAKWLREALALGEVRPSTASS